MNGTKPVIARRAPHNRIADVTVSLLSFPSGVRAHIFVSWLHPFKEQKLIVVGDRKMAVFNDMEEKDKLLLYPHSIEWKNHVPAPNFTTGHFLQGLTLELAPSKLLGTLMMSHEGPNC